MLKILNEIASPSLRFADLSPGQMFIHVSTGRVCRKAANSAVAYDFVLNVMNHLKDDDSCVPVEADLVLRERSSPGKR